jgi:hypothetical protein
MNERKQIEMKGLHIPLGPGIRKIKKTLRKKEGHQNSCTLHTCPPAAYALSPLAFFCSWALGTFFCSATHTLARSRVPFLFSCVVPSFCLWEHAKTWVANDRKGMVWSRMSQKPHYAQRMSNEQRHGSVRRCK